MQYDKHFHGKNGFHHFFGVIEDVNDPLKLGRVRVRCFGWHTEDLTQLPTAGLPWATLMLPTTSASVSGIGVSGTGAVPGTMAFGFFIDGMEAQMPVIMGTFASIPAAGPNTAQGFADPSGTYPAILNEPDTNRLARNESIDQTVVQSKLDNLDSATIAGGGEVTEPETPYAAIYPKNKVFQSESGHIVEFDDTPNAERIHEYHKSGTFREIHPGGAVVEKTVSNKYEVVEGTSIIHSNSKAEAVDGQYSVKANGITLDTTMVNVSQTLSVGNGATGTFTTTTGQVVIVVDGIVTSIT